MPEGMSKKVYKEMVKQMSIIAFPLTLCIKHMKRCFKEKYIYIFKCLGTLPLSLFGKILSSTK